MGDTLQPRVLLLIVAAVCAQVARAGILESGDELVQRLESDCNWRRPGLELRLRQRLRQRPGLELRLRQRQRQRLRPGLELRQRQRPGLLKKLVWQLLGLGLKQQARLLVLQRGISGHKTSDSVAGCDEGRSSRCR